MRSLSKLFALLVLAVWADGCTTGDEYRDTVPVYLTGIEAFNINNEGAVPIVTDLPVRKEAYMIGVKFFLDDSRPGGDQYVTPAERDSYNDRVGNSYQTRIYCNTAFDDKNPAGSNISQYFKSIKYIPGNLDQGFVLLATPQSGQHSFKVVYYSDGQMYSYDTDMVELY